MATEADVMTKSKTEYKDVKRHPSKITRTIELPWQGGIEIGTRQLRSGRGFVTACHPDGILEKLNANSFQLSAEGFEPHNAEESIQINSVVPYYISSCRDGIDIYISFRVIIGDTYIMPFSIGQCDHGSGCSEIKLGNPVLVPPRQPCVIEVRFERMNKAFKEALIKAEEEGTMLRFGLKLIGVTKTVIESGWY
jgi:hypothetical protein